MIFWMIDVVAMLVLSILIYSREYCEKIDAYHFLKFMNVDRVSLLWGLFKYCIFYIYSYIFLSDIVLVDTQLRSVISSAFMIMSIHISINFSIFLSKPLVLASTEVLNKFCDHAGCH